MTLEEQAQDYLDKWFRKADGYRLERRLSARDKKLIDILLLTGHVSRKFNGGDPCFVVNDLTDSSEIV